MKRILSIMVLILLSGSVLASANDWTVPMYSIEGHIYSIPQNETDAYNKVGLYYTPVSMLYTLDGVRYIAPLNEVASYRANGCFPLHAFLFEATFDEIVKVLGPFEYVDYYPGTPFSGDLPRYYYKTSKSNLLPIESIGVYEGKCVDVTLRLKDVFPYLALFADDYGRLTINQIMTAFENNNFYGLNYRTNKAESIFESLSEPVTYEDESWYFFDYDNLQISIEGGWDGRVNYDTARCSFNIMI